MSIPANHLHIDRKYAFNIQMLTSDVQLFWSKRNVQKLSTFYLAWAQDLISHQFDPFDALDSFFETLEELLPSSSDEEAKVSNLSDSEASEELLTSLELKSMIKDYKSDLVHQVALHALKAPSHTENLEEEIKRHALEIQKSHSLLNRNTNRVIEKSFHFSQVDLNSLEKLQLIGREINALSKTFEDALISQDPALLELLKGNKSSFKSKAPLIEHLSSLYQKQIEILSSLKLTSMNTHLEWVQSLIQVRSKIENHLQKMSPKSPTHLKFVEIYKNITAQEKRAVELSHVHFLEASEKYKEYNILLTEKVSDLFLVSLKPDEIFLFDFDKNEFVTVNLSQNLPQEEAIFDTLKQIKLVVKLLLSQSIEMKEIVKAALGADYSLAGCIASLFKTMFKIQKTFLTHTQKALKVAEQFDLEIQEHIKKHIEDAYQLAAQKSSKKQIVQVQDFFSEGSVSHFYLKLALDLKIHAVVKPAEMPVSLFLELIKHVENGDRLKNLDPFEPSYNSSINPSDGVTASSKITPLDQLICSNNLFSCEEASSGAILTQEVQSKITKRILKTKEKITEILIHGLRSYHFMLSTLSTFLEWSPEDLQMMFENYLIKEHLKKQKKGAKKITSIDVLKFRSETQKMSLISSQAGSLAEQFVKYLQPYRTLQLYMVQFYNALGNIVFQTPNYMQLEPLTEEDLNLLELKLDKVKSGYFNDIDVKTAEFLKPHIQELKQLIKETPQNRQAEAVNRFLQTKMLRNDHPPLTKGTPLSIAGVSYISIKLLIRIIALIDKGSALNGFNLDLFTQLFTKQNSPWEKFTEATKQGMREKVESEIGAFITSPFKEASPLGFYYDLEPQESPLWEYYQISQPFLIMTPIINVQNKWNSYLRDLTQLLDEVKFKKSFEAIQDAAVALNESERLLSALSTSPSKKRAITTILSEISESFN